jgi:predicted GH43/DUF377 family glycosyl hydrolase
MIIQPQEELLIPGKITTFNCPFLELSLNAGIIEAWGKTYCLYRLKRIPSYLLMCELLDDYESKDHILKFEMWDDDPIRLPEDPRLIFYNNEIICFITAVRAVILPNGLISGQSESTIMMVRLGRDLEIKHQEICDYKNKTVSEKNWVPFIHKNKLKIIYNHDPFTILTYNGASWDEEKFDNVIWDYGRIRGGAPLVKKDGLYYHFFHSHTIEDEVRVYHVGVYAFDDNFKIVKMSKTPIMSGNKDNYTTPWVLKLSALFPCGVILRNNKWIISYGWLDTELRFAEIDVNELEKCF